jgi:hypothetical protein
VALCFIEDHQALYSQIEEGKNDISNLPTSNTQGQLDWMNYLHKKVEVSRMKQLEAALQYRAIKETFYDDYNTLRKKINDKLKKAENLINSTKTRR